MAPPRSRAARRSSPPTLFSALPLRYPSPAADELVVDSFAGGGGASSGIAAALGRPVDVAINHDPDAIAMHTANHPDTVHYTEDVFAVDPRSATHGRPVRLFWLSPDCRHFSRAKGAKPVSKKIRGLAWIAVRWAREVRPRVIILENVREFADWGPLGTDHLPDPERRGLTFRRFVGNLRGLGYVVDWRVLNAADFGAPTHRRRLFLVARCDGLPIAWPEPTHGPNRSSAWRPAAEAIDWSIPCPSIFGRKRPLAEATLRRIANGLRRYVFEASEPFIVRTGHWSHRTGEGFGFRGQSTRDPLGTVCATNEKALVMPHVTKFRTGSVGSDAREPLPTITANSFVKRPGGAAPLGVVQPYVVSVAHGESGGRREYPITDPLGTVTESRAHALVSPFVAQFFGGMVGKPADAPLPAVTAIDHNGLVAAALVKQNFGSKPASGAGEPLHTITSQTNRHNLAAAFLEKFYTNGAGADLREPLPTITGQGEHLAEVRAFLLKWYGTSEDGQRCDVPLGTVTSHDRFGLVTVAGELYQVVDIGLRMLTPRELARAQGFPDGYTLTGTKTSQVARIGNSVPPPLAEAVVRANFAPALEEALAV